MHWRTRQARPRQEVASHAPLTVSGAAQRAAIARGAARSALKVTGPTTPDPAATAVALEEDWQRRNFPVRFLDFVYSDGRP
ncbi:MAG: hypothetical protein JWO29_1146 [Arthrobacter sp.]|nr:hypothetical protein [Arthrobacter sp.]